MNAHNQIATIVLHYSKNSFLVKKIRYILIALSSVLLLPIQQVKPEQMFLKCTGKFEINRGELIRPDWETTYLTINLNGIKSIIDSKGITKEGRTLIRRNSYTITYRDNSNRIKSRYKINNTNGNYIVDYPQRNRTLLGNCEKGRG